MNLTIVQEINKNKTTETENDMENTKAPMRTAAIVPKYSPMLFALLVLLLIDLCINAFGELAKSTSMTTMLIIYMLVYLEIVHAEYPDS
jgi:hypothetical protein